MQDLPLLDAFADHLRDGVVVLDAAGRLVRMNRAARLQHGLAPDAPLPATVAALAEHADARAPEGDVLAPAAWPHARAAAGEAVDGLVDLVDRATGRRRRCRCAAARVDADAGPLAVLTLRDVPLGPTATARTSAHWYRTLFYAVDDEVLVYHLTPDGQPDGFIEVNAAACRILGYTREELLGMRVMDIVDPASVSVSDAVERLRRDGHVVLDTIHRTRDGRAVPVETSAVLFELDGRPTVLSVCRDRTERHRREAALRERAEHFATIANSIPQVVWLARPDGAFTYANAHWYAYTGLPVAGTEGARWLQAVHPDHLGAVREAWEAGIRGAAPYEIEIPLRRSEDGAYRWHLVRSRPLHDADGAVEGWVGIALDIHDRREGEESTRFLAELAELLQGLDDPDAVLAAAARLLGAHLGAARCVYGLVDDEEGRLLITGEYTRAPGSSAQLRLADFGTEALGLLRAGRPYVVRHAAAEPSAHALVTVPLLRNGALVALLSVHDAAPRAWTAREVELATAVANRCWEAFERARAERALVENEQRLRLAQQVGRVGVFEWLIPEDRNIWSPELARLYGLEPHALEGDFAGWRRRVVDEDADAVEAGIQQSIAQRAAHFAYEFRAVLPDGTHRWLAGMARFVYADDGTPLRMIGVNVDIDERKRAEEALRYNEERYRLAARATNDAIWDWDLRTGEVGWNRAIADLFGWHDAVHGTIAGWWKEHIHPDDQGRVVQAIHNVIDGRGEHWQAEYRFRRADGTYAPVYDRGYVLRDADGTPLRMVGAMLDLTELKLTEAALRESEARLRTLNASLEARVAARTGDLRRAVRELESRNQELQDFAYVASHDLQEPLRKITVFSDLLLAEADDRLLDEDRAYVGRMQHAAHRMSALIQGLLVYSRVQTQGQAFRPLDVGAVVGEVLGDLEVAIDEADARVEVDVAGTVEADPTQVRQLVQNLVGNALKFREDGAAPIITVHSRVEAADAAEWFVLEVADNGIGFEEEYAERIFAPFQRLHGRSAYPGTGMGLAICRRIAERHGGEISVRSTPGQGSTFTVRLPLTHDGAGEGFTETDEAAL